MNYFSDKNIFIILLYIGVLFFLVIMPYIDNQNLKEQNEYFSNFLSNDNIRKIDQNVCSTQCCKHTQWPTPFNTKDPNIDPKLFENYIGSNFSCNNGHTGGGCLCIDKKDYDYLSNHGS